uniref:ARAD1D50732p n=1 Tax=Blastobotrys adeninivorans TaxID=409370 RepID=A0A060TDU1_BLAAD
MSNIKFVIQSEPTVRRPRVRRACTECQNRKVRCSGIQPCTICQARNLKCVFNAVPETASTKQASKRKRSEPNNNPIGSTAESQTSQVLSSFSDEGGSNSIHELTSNDQPINVAGPKIVPIASSGSTKAHSSSKAATSPVSERSSVSSGMGHEGARNTDPSPSQTSNRPKSKVTRHPYFRWLGPTAIAPPKSGRFRLLSINVRQKDDDSHQSVVVEREDDLASVSQGRQEGIGPSEPRSSQDNGSGSSDVLGGLTGRTHALSLDDAPPPLPSIDQFSVFLDNIPNYLPYPPLENFQQRMGDGVISDCLLYAMASISERLRGSEILKGDESPSAPTLASRYSETAKRLVIPHLASPSVEIAYALLLIGFSEFAEDRDSGLWSWAGMGIRMCYDLGLHKKGNLSGDEEEVIGRKVFWAAICLDRWICCGTGRICSIPQFDIEYPCDLGTVTGPDGISRTDPFPYLCRLLELVGRVTNYINSFQEDKNKVLQAASNIAVSPESWDMVETFSQFQQELSDFYTALPRDLHFDVQNFQVFSKMRRSQVFLQLHVWHQALVLTVHHPKIAYPHCKLDVEGLIVNPHADLTITGAISIADMIAFADLIDSKSFLANPFLAQPIYMAASASLTLWQSLPVSAPSTSMHTLQRTYSTCRRVLQRMQHIWRGIYWHGRTLDSIAASEPDLDFSMDSRGTIITQDLGVLRKVSMDESTRKWLVDTMDSENADDIYGLFVSGLTEDTVQESGQSGNQKSSETERSSMNHNTTGTFNSPDKDFKLPPKTPVNPAPSVNRPAQEDSFRNILLRNIQLDEYFEADIF